MMEFEHENAGQALRRMRALTDHYRLPEDACNRYRSLFRDLQALEAYLHMHIHMENNVLHC
jgi:regulator of cell morphogenesis and NO signaling